MERESLSDALAVLKSKGFWKILGAASVIASSIASGVAFVGKPGLVWITSQREELRHDNKLTATRLDGEMKERLKSEHSVEEFQRKVESELIAICREHVRFVAASRRQQVGDVLTAYDTFVKYWPCGIAQQCDSPSMAAERALSLSKTALLRYQTPNE